ncbi:hypothetical protein NDU88_004221 [Pleurodeles waltl]|uniref:Uncharacterized protein n=1 Tax=Pleurodeles waltl TaxID=8319 RepID=A0AAV7W8F3_PLEWA|nr:hypothetical protein NDU88_004221 [Pleurodeles waltl]
MVAGQRHSPRCGQAHRLSFTSWSLQYSQDLQQGLHRPQLSTPAVGKMFHGMGKGKPFLLLVQHAARQGRGTLSGGSHVGMSPLLRPQESVCSWGSSPPYADAFPGPACSLRRGWVRRTPFTHRSPQLTRSAAGRHQPPPRSLEAGRVPSGMDQGGPLSYLIAPRG